MPEILIVEDDIELANSLRDYLELEQFSVTLCHRGDDAVAMVPSHQFDLVLLDIMLPGLSGLDVLRKTRELTNTPILILTAKGDDTDSVLGLELGADDYLAKPTNPRVLLARIRAHLRRVAAHSQSAKEYSLGDFHISAATRVASFNNNLLPLTGAEFDVLFHLTEKPGQVVSKEDLFQQVLGREMQPFDRSIDVHVSNLRKKLAAAEVEISIVTVRGTGYQLSTGHCS